MAFNPALLEDALKYFFNVSTPAIPSQHWVSLHGGPTGTNGANEIVEPAWYARQMVNWTLQTANVGWDSGGSWLPVVGSNILTFTDFGVWNSSTGGTFIFGGALTPGTIVITPGEMLLWVAGGIQAYVIASGNRASPFLTSNLARYLLGISPERPSAFTVGFHFAEPGPSGANEYSAGGYARTGAITFAAGAANDGEVENSNSVTSGTADPSWGETGIVSHYGIYGQGLYLIGASVSTESPPVETPQAGFNITIETGDLKVSMA